MLHSCTILYYFAYIDTIKCIDLSGEQVINGRKLLLKYWMEKKFFYRASLWCLNVNLAMFWCINAMHLFIVRGIMCVYFSRIMNCFYRKVRIKIDKTIRRTLLRLRFLKKPSNKTSLKPMDKKLNDSLICIECNLLSI